MNLAINPNDLENPTLPLRLKTETAAEHERMHQLMGAADVFSSMEKYTQFTLSQYYFQVEIEELFKQDAVVAHIPDLDIRGRSEQALLDLQDLKLQPQGRELAVKNVQFPAALGWIYVSEGSTLGAAFLFKQAQASLGLTAEHGARNLAAYPEGRAKVWKRFVEALDQAQFSKEQQDQVVQGALDAFDYFGELLINIDQLK
ncbi:heme oxygenase [Acinetobacter calcoaceticus]|uniref:Heme oxygenase n=1 Tax=Acinetobacter calcoaceticus TaxID=471 RepID=A0A4R1Y0R2_ACICA|nr:heme oxygenase [Acinetobacter calcoaceticus]